MTPEITRDSIVGIFPRKGKKCYKVRRGFTTLWTPVSETKVYDAKSYFSYLKSETKFPTMENGASIILEKEDTIIYHDGAVIGRHKVPAGTKLTLIWVSGHSNMCNLVGIELPN